jgi:AAA domain
MSGDELSAIASEGSRPGEAWSFMSTRPAPSKQQFVADALRAIGALFKPGDVIEIRALQVGRTAEKSGVTYSGYFNFESRDAIAKALAKVDGSAEGVYVVLNRFNPALLARANNRLQARPKYTTSDADITERVWLYIDCDPVRPAGISSTDAEHEAALARAGQIRAFLTSCRWPEPIYCDSGNGGHLLYRLPVLDLANAGELVKRCLKVLNKRFSDTTVTVDESTATASRLCKLYGTQTRKGDPMPDRPHRRARILEEPDQVQPVRVDLLVALADEATEPASRPQSRTNAGTSAFNIDHWLASGHVEVVKGPDRYNGGRRWILQACAFNTEHIGPAIIELANGALVYKCLHQSCAIYDWRAFRNQVDLGSSSGRMQRPADFSATPEASSAPLITDLAQLPSVWSLETRIEWCVETMIARGSVNLICSESGTGKTWLGYYLAGCVARGVPVLDRAVCQSKVLYLDGENPLFVVKQRLFDLGIVETPDLLVWGGWNISQPQGPQSSLLIEFAHQHKGLFIFDSLIEFHPGSEQSSTETRAFMRFFRALANLGATVIILHHSGKAETAKIYRGSSDIKAAVDTAYQLESVDKESRKLGRLSLKCFKGRLMPGQDFGLEFQQKVGFVACEVAVATMSVEEVVAEILKVNPGSKQKDIVQLGRSRGSSKGQLEECLRTGPWRRQPGPNNSILYSLVDPFNRDQEAEI